MFRLARARASVLRGFAPHRRDVMTEDELLQTLARVVGALDETGIRFAVAGGCAVYARGGPPSDHDVDIFLKDDDVAVALRALERAGMRSVDPPENWLVKVFDGDVLVDLVFRPNYQPVTDALFERATRMRVGSTKALVISATDLMIDKLLVLDAHRCDFVPLLRIARDLREQVHWPEVAAETGQSPYARSFLSLLRDLHIAGTQPQRTDPEAQERIDAG
jgi:hypothetical protein